jgi:hypothetical protein
MLQDLLIIGYRIAQPLSVCWAMLARITDDKLRLFLWDVFINMPQDEFLKILVTRSEAQEQLHIVPVMRKQPADCVAIFFRDLSMIAMSEFLERTVNAVPILQMTGFNPCPFCFGWRTFLRGFCTCVTDGEEETQYNGTRD